MSMTLFDLAVIGFAALLGASLIVVMRGKAQWRAVAAPEIVQTKKAQEPVFLFRGGVLIDATADALALIAHQTAHKSEYDAVLDAFRGPFPELGSVLQDETIGLTRLICQNDPTLLLEVERNAHCVRITAVCRNETPLEDPLSALSRDLYFAQNDLLRDVAHHAPQLIWQTDLAGNVTWSNQTFMSFAERSKRPVTTSDATSLQSLAIVLQQTADDKQNYRKSIDMTDEDDPHWLDITVVNRDGGTLHFASDANAIMRADRARRNFVQTLGKTFAQLSTGLAIFDRNRQLAMFNPALLDMTKLPVEFLSTQPSIDTVLDRLRELRMMPEPRDYVSWRDQFAAVEDAAKNGTYSANWSLPDGQTLRVIGKPHPDGAFAFLFEDITAEVSLTRRFRTDIETGQAVLDALPDGIAVFSRAGTLMMSNHAYARLWETKSELMLEHRELASEMAVWQSRAVPSAMWDEMIDVIQRLEARKVWSDDVMLEDGRHLRCHAHPISGGMTMVRFTIAPSMRPTIRKLAATGPVFQVGKG
ncbi:PAS-domain containing protein [Loktanella sp. Alg231-35]|uniref:PAS-domain containing protein n=1 Tax=Loktanella sp. Alg231-35 TaxID=1922220 RepID=UPI000D56083A|nr:PAS-domain containing protein [Loktanella sp. Alg231-35]